MNAIEEENEPTETSSPLEPVEDTRTVETSESEALDTPDTPDASSADRTTRKKLEEQLEALKRKEVELRRALVMADHPELVDAIRLLQGRTYALERVEAKLLVGLSRSELRRQETLQKKRDSLSDKRAELDKQLAELDSELHALGTERQQAFETERKQALSELLLALGTHDPALHAAGIEATELVPEIGRWLPEIEALAETLASGKTRAN
jgi:chromosome segregation ATPase